MAKIYVKEINACHQCPALKRLDRYHLKCEIANKEIVDTVYALDKPQIWCPLEDVIKGDVK